MIAISGAGGGQQKQTQRTPTEKKNSLFSTSYAELVDLIGEGEIGGLVDGDKSIFIDNTPLQNTNGSYNFDNVTVKTRNGTQSQDYIPGFEDISSAFSVGVAVVQSTPIERTITNNTVDAVRVAISIPILQEIQPNGDIKGTKVELAISVQYNGGGYTPVVRDVISGRTTQLYQRDYRIDLNGAFPVNIKVIRITPDSDSARINNAFSWASYNQITYAKLRYPNSALIGIRIDSEQFNNIPSRSYRVRGLKVKIPSNGTVNATTGAISYSGVWNGTFGAAQWTSDPAWCLWDLLTARYGFIDHIDVANLDKWSFYAASQYCGTSVANGFGGFEPRFSCNVNIQTEQDAFRLINDMASVFRAMPYWSTGALTINQDRPADPSYLFTYANVSEEGFSYSGSSLKTRPNVAVVQYMDLDMREPGYEVVEDRAGIARYGVIKTEITAFACTSRGQAYRIGEWLLYESLNSTETIAFTASIDAGISVRPGAIIEVSDPVRAGARRGGRIASATTTVVTVDDATGLTYATGSTLSVILGTGAVEARPITAITGTAITVSPAFSSAPNSNSVWVLQTTALQTSTWRVIGIQEQDQCRYTITALAYNSSKYDYIERGLRLQSRTISNLNEIPSSPTGFSATEALYSNADQVRSKVIISWASVAGIAEYLVKWRKDEGNWTSVARQQQDYEILDTTPGLFEFLIYSRSAGGQYSTPPLEGNLTALGKTAPPADVTGFTAALDPYSGVTLSWNPVPDLDLAYYSIWASQNGGPAVGLGNFTATAKTLGIPASGTTQWSIRAVDTSGSSSANAATAALTVAAAPATTINGQISAGVLVLSWTAVAGGLGTDAYELRYGATTATWATATPLATVKATTYSLAVNWGGTRRFFISAIDVRGGVGAAATYDAVIVPPAQPTITQRVVDNNVLLQWGDTTRTLPISSYELRKGSTWATAAVIGTKQGQFTVVFESSSGTYTYWLAGIDSAGNYGTPGSVSARVSQPPDYVLKLDHNSTFSGTKTNLAPDGGGLLASVSTSETWQSHFISRGWTTLQDQVSAGFTYYAMPSQATGQYLEVLDYGAILAGARVTATLTSNSVAGSTTITPTISVRATTSAAWTTYTNVESVFATSFRYVQVQYDFASSGGNNLVQVTALNIRLDLKLRNDGGNGTASASDTGGTVVNFNNVFIDIDSISVTPTTTSPVLAVYDFVDAPNPTSFKVLLFNTSGARVSGGFSWSARGV